MRTRNVFTVGLLSAFVAVGFVQAESTNLSAQANLELKASAKRVNAGDVISVEVYLKDTSDVAVYQVQVMANGGRQGSLALESIVIDKEREDFVFGTETIIDAVDTTKQRSGALMMNGSTDVTDARYLVTYNFRASRDASGTFNVRVQSGDETFLLNPNSERIAARGNTGVEIIVGGRTGGRTIKGR